MQRRRLGGLEVSAVGLGCATMTPFYDEPDRDSAIDTLRRAREIGVDFLDSSDAYGQGRNEELIAHAAIASLFDLEEFSRAIPCAGSRGRVRVKA